MAVGNDHQPVGESVLLNVADRIYRMLLYAYPTRFRRDFGVPMAQLFRDDARDTLRSNGAAGLIRFLLFTLVDMSKTVVIEHVDELIRIAWEVNMDSYHDIVQANAADADQMERLYKEAHKGGDFELFKHAIEESYQSSPDNLLFAAWYHRLQNMPQQVKRAFAEWGWIVPLAIINGLLMWWLSDDRQFRLEMVGVTSNSYPSEMPLFVLLAAPLSALFVLVYLTMVSRRREGFSAFIAVTIVGACAYVIAVYPQIGIIPFQEQYLTLMAMHLMLLGWMGIGTVLLAEQPDPVNRFSFLIKSLEVFVVGGLFIIAGGLFAGITIGLFEALSITLPDVVARLLFAGGGGMVPVVATGIIYNPNVPPADQSFDEGLSKMVALLLRLMLPLTLIVLVVYMGFIPFNFRQPFENRDVLIIYNGMLFAVIALLIGATPVSLADDTPRTKLWLRRGIIGVSALALMVSVYALSAIVYRTVIDRLTPNRLAFIGWNVINIGLLVLILLLQVRSKNRQWLYPLFGAFSVGTSAYAVWTVTMIVALPWLFGINEAEIASLPVEVQEIAYERSGPILLKCDGREEIYLLEGGKKRWIDTIETFERRGYVWGDVNHVMCTTLDDVPDGVSIPADAGSPPLS